MLTGILVTAYARLRSGDVAWTAEAGEDANVDVDSLGRPLGVEVIGDGDWRDALVQLALEGRVRIMKKSDSVLP